MLVGMIVLATLNAKYLHAAFGLRYLLANMGALRERTTIAEFDINQRPIEIAEKLLASRRVNLGRGDAAVLETRKQRRGPSTSAENDVEDCRSK